MKKVYSHENLTIVQTAKGLLELSGVQCFLKNEYHGAGGHVGMEMIPIELWVHRDADSARAINILEEQYGERKPRRDWKCKKCAEANDGSFETCWKCQTERA